MLWRQECKSRLSSRANHKVVLSFQSRKRYLHAIWTSRCIRGTHVAMCDKNVGDRKKWHNMWRDVQCKREIVRCQCKLFDVRHVRYVNVNFKHFLSFFFSVEVRPGGVARIQACWRTDRYDLPRAGHGADVGGLLRVL